MDKQYTYPLDLSWSTEEISSVLSFLNAVEAAYETGIAASALLEAYQIFKQVVPAKGQERQIDREFEEASGYSTYQAVQAAKKDQKGRIRLGR